MNFPVEISDEIAQYAWAWRAPLRDNWREGSSIIYLLKGDRWWSDFKGENQYSRMYIYETWVEWCKDKLIIGPPRGRSERELCGFDEDYLSMEEFRRHFVPWMETWPEPGDHSWCKVRAVPDWAVKEYLENK